MSTISLSADLVVVGGGLAGVCAALAAAREGAQVILVQDRSVLGGNASSEVKMHIVGADCHGTRPGARESGLIEELKLEDAMRNPHGSYSQWDLLLYEKVTSEPNITLLLDTDCVGCETSILDGKRRIAVVKAIRTSTEDEFRLCAPFFADCSGDGRLGFEAGADYVMGREAREEFDESLALETADDHTLGSSILFTARRYDSPQPFMAPPWIRKFAGHEFQYRPIKSYEYGYWWFEWGGHLDVLKDNPAIRHELLRIALGIWDFVKNSGKHPDAANWALEWVGSFPGKRESRRFRGPWVLTQKDVQSGRVFDDTVAYGGWWLDLHPPHGIDAIHEEPCVQHDIPHLYGIPLRCLYSRNIENLFFAGRNISATHVAFASTRVMGTCAVMGQAIGTAAAVASFSMRASAVVESCRESGPNGLPTPTRHPISPDREEGTPGAGIKRAGIAAIFDAPTLQELQQRLLRNDAFLPNIAAEDAADVARRAKISASSATIAGSPANVVDGITRQLFTHLGSWADGATHRWQSGSLSAWLQCEWTEPQAIAEIHLTFDSAFERELILSASQAHTRKVVRGPQPELVKDYDLLLDGKIVTSIRGNYLRKRVHLLPGVAPASTLRIVIHATHGCPEARIFEVRVYRRSRDGNGSAANSTESGSLWRQAALEARSSPR